MNVTHSLDAYLLREMELRCNYDLTCINNALYEMQYEQDMRNKGIRNEQDLHEATNLAQQLIAVWGGCEMPAARLLNCLSSADVQFMADKHIEQLIVLAYQIIERKSFEIVTVH